MHDIEILKSKNNFFYDINEEERIDNTKAKKKQKKN